MNNPLYLKIVKDIKEKIRKGILKTGDIIASETNLCKEYGASRMTVRKGLAILAHEGYIFSIPGKGNFIQAPNNNEYVIHFDEMKNPINCVDRTKLISVNIIKPNDKLIDSLQITQNKKIITIERVFYTDAEPIAYDVKYLVYQKGMPLVETELENATFPEIIYKDRPSYLAKKEITFYARTPDEMLRKCLNIPNDFALLVVEQKFNDHEDKPIGLGITSYRGDYIKLCGKNNG